MINCKYCYQLLCQNRGKDHELETCAYALGGRPQTNRDRFFIGVSVEELAKNLAKMGCPDDIDSQFKKGLCVGNEAKCAKCWLDWLEEDSHD